MHLVGFFLAADVAAAPTPSLADFVLLLVAATFVSLFVRRVHVPYTVALVVVGLIMGWFHLFAEQPLSRDMILTIFVPPLLFEGTLAMDVRMMRTDWREVSLLAGLMTLLCFIFLSVLAHAAFGYAWPVAFLLGAILSPTDPVSVLALMRELGAPRRLSLMLEAESCFNDGLGVVIFGLVMATTQGESLSAAGACGLFVREAFGGLLTGMVLGFIVNRLLRFMNDHLAETMISLELAYGAYVTAEQLHVSGIMAVIAAGLIIGNVSRVKSMSTPTRELLFGFWEVIAFIANSVLFMLMGISLKGAFASHSVLKALLLFGGLIAWRQLTTYSIGAWLRAIRRPLPTRWLHVLGWGGVRGSIPLALALGLPAVVSASGPTRHELVSLVFGVVLLSLLIQGMTIGPLLEHFNLRDTRPGSDAAASNAE